MKSAGKTILLIALVCAAPLVSALLAYYFMQPSGGKSYGALLPTAKLPSLPEGTIAPGDMALWNGKWRVVFTLSGPCDTPCRDVLYATRQARTLLARERNRVTRVALVTERPTAEMTEAHPDVLFVMRPPALPEAWGRALDQGILLVDPLDNQVLLWPRQPDIKKLHQDLARLLRVSAIG